MSTEHEIRYDKLKDALMRGDEDAAKKEVEAIEKIYADWRDAMRQRNAPAPEGRQ